PPDFSGFAVGPSVPLEPTLLRDACDDGQTTSQFGRRKGVNSAEGRRDVEPFAIELVCGQIGDNIGLMDGDVERPALTLFNDFLNESALRTRLRITFDARNSRGPRVQRADREEAIVRPEVEDAFPFPGGAGLE